ncbi:MAG: hypothetical protein ACPICB_07435, partial [Candidatus Poseidoniaceae archaeon]
FGGAEPFLHPMPLDSAWKKEEYKQWIQWLMQHPDQLRTQKRHERTLIIGDVNVTFVHGDILDHLDWLESINASLVLRRRLLTNCLEKNPYLIKNSVNLQPRWDINPISNLKWSGIDANQNLTDEIMKLSRTNTIATIVHGDSTINQLSKALSKVKKNPVQRLILFHKDSNDYEFH